METFPTAGSTDGKKPSESYLRQLRAEAAKLEGTAKAFLASEDDLPATARRLIPTITDAEIGRLLEIRYGKGVVEPVVQLREASERLQAGMREGLGGVTRALREIGKQ